MYICMYNLINILKLVHRIIRIYYISINVHIRTIHLNIAYKIFYVQNNAIRNFIFLIIIFYKLKKLRIEMRIYTKICYEMMKLPYVLQ